MEEKLRANLRWWLTVTRLVESQPEYRQAAFRMQIEGRSFDEIRSQLIEDGHKKMTKERVRLICRNMEKLIADSLAFPLDGNT